MAPDQDRAGERGHRLTAAQREVLTMLAERGPMPTSRTTHPALWVAGTTASALGRRGLVDSEGSGADYRVFITEAGRAALSGRSIGGES